MHPDAFNAFSVRRYRKTHTRPTFAINMALCIIVGLLFSDVRISPKYSVKMSGVHGVRFPVGDGAASQKTHDRVFVQ